jgi:ribosomal protein S18 acetylase RimI-like enzyme
MSKISGREDKNQSPIEIREEPLSWLAEYGQISIAFSVNSVYDLIRRDCDLGDMTMSERRLETPYVKDYDSIPGNSPADWAIKFDISNWGLLSANIDSKPVGAAAIAYKSPGLVMLEGEADQAVLWDIRISPEWRGKGIGSMLLAASEKWAKARGCLKLIIETQNNNVAACKFYAKCGYILGEIRPNAYPEFPDEIQLIWQKIP